MHATVRPEIAAMDGYVPGEQPQAGKFIKLNTNENPYPCFAERAAGRSGACCKRGLQQYPDPMATAFRTRAAEVLGVEPDWILCGNGSDDILTIVTRAFVGQGEWLRLPYPSYILYRTLAEIQGAASEEVHFERRLVAARDEFAAPRDGLQAGVPAESEQPVGHDGPAGARAASWPSGCPARCWSTKRTSTSPTRTAWSSCSRTRRSWSRARSASRTRWPGCGSATSSPSRRSSSELVKVKDSYNCDALSIAGATAAIDDQAWLAENRGKDPRHARAADARHAGARLRAASDRRPTSSGARIRSVPVKPLYEQLKAAQVLVRYMNYAGWGDGLRITVGTDEQIDACLSLLQGMM